MTRIRLPEDLRRYNAKTFSVDLIAGMTGAVAGTPQAMGFAIIAGINPIYGLYTAMVSTIIGAVFCRTPMMTVGPTNALALVVGSTLLRFDDASQSERLFTLTLLAGVFQLVFGLLRLGSLTRFISNAVMTGFISGVALLVILGQLRNFTGYRSTVRGGPLPKFWDWLTHIDQGDGRTVLVGGAAVVLILLLNRTRWRSTSTLAAIVLASGFVALAGWDSVPTVRDTVSIPSGLPDLHLPQLQYAPELLSPALALAVLASVQSAGLASVLPSPDFHAPSGNRDLAGQGLANIAGGLWRGMPAGGSLSRTVVNMNAGAQSRMANVWAGVLIGVVVIGLGHMIEQIVMTALAAQLITAAARVIDPRRVRVAWRVNRSAQVTMGTTFLATLILPLEYSIYIGVGLSLVLYVYNSASSIKIVRLVPDGGHQFHEADVPETLPSGVPVILSVSGNLYFAAVYKLRAQLPEPGDAQRPVVILRLRNNAYLGSTGIRLLEAYAAQLEARQGKLLLVGIGPQIEAELRRTGSLDRIGRDNLFPANSTIFAGTEKALAYARVWLGEAAALHSVP
ncbi:MAG: SulP family inorganic anion transporter [Anaerolineae bacterium]|nr:SulP family inorganic anion transporter [Anaerolineae bacterium]